MRKKVQTRGQANGSGSITQLGWVAEERLEADIEQERHHFSRIAARDGLKNPIKDVTTNDALLVVVYENDGQFLLIQWLTEQDQTS